MLVLGAIAGPLAWRAADTALTPASEPLSAAAAEREIAARYPCVRALRHSLIACPSRSIEPDGEARCWVQLAVGLQRSLVVRLSARGNAIEIDD